MPQIILYEWKIIFSGSLLYKTPTPWFVVQLFKMPDTKATCALSLYYLKVMLVE